MRDPSLDKDGTTVDRAPQTSSDGTIALNAPMATLTGTSLSVSRCHAQSAAAGWRWSDQLDTSKNL